MNSFDTVEKGSREWNLFNPIKNDRVSMFKSFSPVRPQPRYTNVVPIRRYHTHPATA